MTVYCIAVTFFAAFMAGFLVATLRPSRTKKSENKTIIKSDAERTLENFLNYNGEIQ